MSEPTGPEPLGRPDASPSVRADASAGWSAPGRPNGPGGGLHWAWPVAVLSLALLLLITAAGGALVVLGQQREIRSLEQDLQRTRAELQAAREELAAGGGEAPAGAEDEGGLGGLLDGLLEGLDGLEGEDGLGGLLDELDGGDGLLACLATAMAPDGEVQPVPQAGAEEQVPAIAERVEQLRGHTFPDEVATRFVDGPAFEAEVREAFEADYGLEDADADQRALVALGAIPPGTDLRARYLELISGQAAGFYDTETREIVVRAEPGEVLSPTGQVTLAHELEHALSDARLGLPELEELDDDAARGALGLVEGSASLAMQQFAGRALGPADQMRLALDPAAAQAQAQLEDFPHHLQRDLVFPYEDGLAFACDLHAEGGWDAVDEAFSAPPSATAHILWPERYRAGEEPAAPRPFAAPPAGFSEARSSTFGAAELLWLLEAPGGDVAAAVDGAAERAAAWDGGALRVLSRAEDTAVGLALVQRPGEADLCDSVATWYRAAFPGGEEVPPEEGERLAVDGTMQDAVLACGDGEVRLGIGPDTATARSAAG